MSITVSEILSSPIFRDAQLLAGAKGLHRLVKRIGVYDYVETVYDVESYLPHTLFISNLGQFKQQGKNLSEALQMFIQTKASGICIMEDNIHLVTPELITFCNEKSFPVISFNRDLLYSDIIADVSHIIQSDSHYAVLAELLEKLLFERHTESSKLHLIHRLNANFKDFVCVLDVRGLPHSELFQNDFEHFFDNKKENLYVKYKDTNVFIFSDDQPSRLSKSVSATIDKIKSMYGTVAIGKSMTENLLRLDKALENALAAVEISQMTHTSLTEYNPISDMYLLTETRGSSTAAELFETVYQLILSSDSSEKIKYLDCVIRYVDYGGDYKKVAQEMFVHENTVRYRINDLKERLGLSDNPIRFHEILSLFVSMYRLNQNDSLDMS